MHQLRPHHLAILSLTPKLRSATRAPKRGAELKGLEVRTHVQMLPHGSNHPPLNVESAPAGALAEQGAQRSPQTAETVVPGPCRVYHVRSLQRVYQG